MAMTAGHRVEPPTRSSAADGKRQRDPYLDNAKGVLVLLVVVGHTIGQTATFFEPGMVAYRWIYLFHMPAFILVTGFLSNGRELDGQQVRSLVGAVIAPYVIFQLAYMLLLDLHGRADVWSLDGFLQPVYQLWFLPALLLWRLSAPFLLRLRGAVPISVAVSLLSPLATNLGPSLSLNRYASFLPFFTIGLLIGRKPDAPRPPALRAAAAGVVIAGLGVAFIFENHLARGWLFWDRTYAALHVTPWVGIPIRAALLAVSLLMAASVLTLLPRRTTVFTTVGRWSMYPYLLHGSLAWAFAWLGWASLVNNSWRFVIMVISAVLVAMALASAPVRRVFRPIANVNADLLLRRTSP